MPTWKINGPIDVDLTTPEELKDEGQDLTTLADLTDEQLQMCSDIISSEPGYHQVNPINQRKALSIMPLSPIPEANVREYLILNEEKLKLIVELDSIKKCLSYWPEGSWATDNYADQLTNVLSHTHHAGPLRSLRWMVIKAGGIRNVMTNHTNAIYQRLAQIGREMLELGIIPEGDKLPDAEA